MSEKKPEFCSHNGENFLNTWTNFVTVYIFVDKYIEDEHIL